MEPMEVIDLSSDDEKSPPKKRDITERHVIANTRDKKVKNNYKSVNGKDMVIVYNPVKGQKQAIDRPNVSFSNVKKRKLSEKEDSLKIAEDSLNKKIDISTHKINKIKPQTVSTKCTLQFSKSQTTDKNYSSNQSPRKDRDSTSLSNHNLIGQERLKLPRHGNGTRSFKINEGASSSKQITHPQLTVKNIIKMPETSESNVSPSAEMIESFFDACRSQDCSEDMKKIIAKLRKRFNNLQPSYVKSGSFMQLIRKKKDSVVNNRSKIFLHIAEVMDEMKARQIQKKPLIKNQNNCHIEEPETSAQQELSEVLEDDNDTLMVEDPKDMEKLLALEKAMRRCERYINKCEKAEVNFDDEEDSHYIMAVKYKARMVELYNRYCVITGERADAARPYLRPKYLSVAPLPPLNNAITSFINMNIAKVNKSLAHMPKRSRQICFTDALIFPDFVDILNCVKKCNVEQNLQLNKQQQESIAKDAFLELGRHLKRCRQADYYDTFSLYLEQEDCDPAATDKNLNEILTKNQELGEKKMQQLLQEFVEKENTAKATGNESCMEKEDQETGDESSESTDDENSHLSDDEKIYSGEISNSDEDETNKVNAKQQDDLNQNCDNDTELNKPCDNLEQKAGDDLEIDKPEDDSNPESCDDIELNEMQNNTNEKVHDNMELGNQQHKLNCKVDEDVKVDNRQANLSDEDTVDLNLNKPQYDLKETTHDDLELEICCTNVEKEAAINEELHDKSRLVPVEKINEKSIDMDASEFTTEITFVDVEMTEKNDMEIAIEKNLAQETEIDCIATEQIMIDPEKKEKTEQSNVKKIAQPEEPIQKTGSTVATCKVNLMPTAKTLKTNLVDGCSPVISVNNTKVIDAPPVATTVELIQTVEEKKPILRVRQFAKPPGSWKDYQSPTKSSAPNTRAVETVVSDLQGEKTSKTLPAENEQSKFIKLTNPISIGKTIQVDNSFIMNLKNNKSTVMIPMKVNSSMPQINVKTVMKNVTFNFNNQVQLQPNIKSTVSHESRPAQNPVNIAKGGKIIASRANVRITNIRSGAERAPTKSNPIQTGEIQKEQTGEIQKQQTGEIEKQQTGEIRKQQTGEIQKQQTGEIRKQQTGEIRKQQTGEIQKQQTGEIRKQQTGEIQKQQTSSIAKPAGHVHLVGQANTIVVPQQRYQVLPPKSRVNQERTIIRNIPPVTDVDGTKTMYRLVKLSPGSKSPNIVVSAEPAVAQNKKIQSSNQRANSKSNSSIVVSSKSKLIVPNSTKKTSSIEVRRLTPKRGDNVYETTTESVPVYVIE